MKRRLFLLLILRLGFAETILIPEDYATIQAGIDASVDGDTVLVADGDYVENLVLDKSIVLTSYAIYDNLDEWIIFDDYYFNQWVINNAHIENTRLIGSSPDDPDYGSVILITPDSDECITPEIIGFTIQGGSGTSVVRVNVEEEEYDVVLGGGILADVSDPHVHHNAFFQNGKIECDDDNLRCNSTYSGGAMQMTSSAEDWSFDNRFENYNPRCEVEGFRLSDNLYNGNDAQYGNTMANRFHEDDFDMSGSIFDVFDCGNEETAVSSIWVKVEPDASVEYVDGAGQLCAFTAPHVYVDSSIPQECLDEGCGFSNNPFKTIARTLEMINPTEDNPITIHLAAGTYSPETGEIFPIQMVSNLNIEGEGDDITIIDASNTAPVMMIFLCVNTSLSNLSIENGLGLYPWIESATNISSGGITIVMSNSILLNNIIIRNNISHGYGGGIFILAANAIISNVIVEGNIAQSGAGISTSGNTIINNTIIRFNTSTCDFPIICEEEFEDNEMITTSMSMGGGILDVGIGEGETSLLLSSVIITQNTANIGGGMMSINSNSSFNEVTINENTADMGGGGISLGSSNSTFTHVVFSGNTALEGGGGGISFSGSDLSFNEVTINENTADMGGGIFAINSNSTFTHMTISENTADMGGGIFLGNLSTFTSVSIFNQVTISDNQAFGDFGGAGLLISNCNPIMNNVNIIGNNSINPGGGVLLAESDPILTNSIIWDNSPESIYLGNNPNYSVSQPIITYSDIEGDWEGEGNIDIDPLFIDLENGDYTLQEGSPCIDAGTADIDGDGEDDITDFIGSAPDMGAYEFGDSSEIMAGDTNFDGILDILDIVRIINQIMGNSVFNDDEFTAADFNADGIVDILDIVQIVNYILDN